MAETLDPFGLFGVTLESSLKELKESYYALALLCHPDKGGSKEEINMVIKSYNFVKEQLEYKTTKTYEELEQELQTMSYESEGVMLFDKLDSDIMALHILLL